MSFPLSISAFGWALIVASMLLAQPSFAAEPDQPLQHAAARLTMAAKLKFTAVVLEGLAFEDFDRIADGANSLSGINELEAFARRRDAAYTAQLGKYRSATDSVLAAAERKDLDAAVSAYHQLTASCVSCHKALRRPTK